MCLQFSEGQEIPLFNCCGKDSTGIGRLCTGLVLPCWLPASTQVRKAPVPCTGLEEQREDRVRVYSARPVQGGCGK